MFVLTLDQRRSRSEPDAVPDLLEMLRSTTVVRAFERTAGDEIQGLLDDPYAVVDVVVHALRDGRWWIGIGIGAIEEPLPETTRAGRGPAYILARDAVDSAKSAPQPVCVRADDAGRQADAEAALWLLADLLGRRTDAGWEAVAAMADGTTQRAAADTLGISAQAMSSRLAVAGWTEERRGRTLAARLLAACGLQEQGGGARAEEGRAEENRADEE